MIERDQKPWYALYVPNGKEEITKQCLETHIKGDIEFVILKRVLKERKAGQWKRVERKLFPGYILVNGALDIETYKAIVSYSPNAKLLRDEDEFHRIEERELRVLGLLASKDKGMIEISSLYKENDLIRVTDGPLVGLEGLILSVNARKGRAKVSIDFIGEKRVVELGIKMVEKM